MTPNHTYFQIYFDFGFLFFYYMYNIYISPTCNGSKTNVILLDNHKNNISLT